MGSNITYGQHPMPAQAPTSSSWEVMDRPVRIGTTHSGASAGSQTPTEHPPPNRAQYVNTQPNQGDVMAAIASEFEMHARRSTSNRNSITGASPENLPFGDSDVTIEMNTGQSNSRNASNGAGVRQSKRSESRNVFQEPVQSHRSNGNSVSSHGSPLSENLNTMDRVAHARTESQYSWPTDDRGPGSNPVRQTRTSQLRNTLTSQNRDNPNQVTSGQGSTVIGEQQSSGPTTNRTTRRRRGFESQGVTDQTSPSRFYEGFQQNPHAAPPPPVASYEDGMQQSTLLNLMTRGFRTFTVEMADVVIDKLRPENESFARHVGQEVKRSTNQEMKQLCKKLEAAEAKLKTLETEKANLQSSFTKEQDETKKEMEKEIMKRAKLYQDQSTIITKLESDVRRLQAAQKDKEKRWRQAEVRAKAEENKRIKIEEDFASKVKDMQKQLDKLKGDLLVEKSVKRIKTMSSTSSGPRASSGRLISHHGGYKKHMVHPKHVPYDEGDD